MRRHLSRKPGLVWALALLLAGCASPLPKPLQNEPPDAPGLPQVAAAPERYLGQRVRWGGVIVGVDNQADSSLVEVLAKPLDSQGRPLIGPSAEGRFLARIAGFLDPLVFRSEREITLGGKLAGSRTRAVGEYPYRYPLVDVDTWHLWEPRPVYRDEPYYWYDPWYDPWYPWGYPYPWWRRHPRFYY